MMDWQQKAAALNSLSQIELHIRKAGDWYVSQRVETGGNGMLLSDYGNGKTPEEAIEDHWRKIVTELPPDRYLVTNAMGNTRKHWRWNECIWKELYQKS